MAISQPPGSSWTMQNGLVEREIVDSISPGDGAPDSEKNELKPWLKECWCLPPQGNAEFVCAMEDVLEVYHREYQDNEVLVCLDEGNAEAPPAAARGSRLRTAEGMLFPCLTGPKGWFDKERIVLVMTT